MAAGGGNAQEEFDTFEKRSKGQVDCVREDGIRKELYKVELKARENWEAKWGFLKNPQKLWREEAIKMNLSPDLFSRHKNKDEYISPFFQEVTSPDRYNFTIKRFPILSSELIGWRSAGIENNLDQLTGSMYTSRKKTMKPPLNPDEPDLSQQKFIILG